MPVIVRLGSGLERDFDDWFLALEWLETNALSAEIIRKSDGVVLQRRVVTRRRNDDA